VREEVSEIRSLAHTQTTPFVFEHATGVAEAQMPWDAQNHVAYLEDVAAKVLFLVGHASPRFSWENLLQKPAADQKNVKPDRVQEL